MATARHEPLLQNRWARIALVVGLVGTGAIAATYGPVLVMAHFLARSVVPAATGGPPSAGPPSWLAPAAITLGVVLCPLALVVSLRVGGKRLWLGVVLAVAGLGYAGYSAFAASLLARAFGAAATVSSPYTGAAGEGARPTRTPPP